MATILMLMEPSPARALVLSQLQADDHSVACETDGSRVLRRVRRDPLDVVIIDLALTSIHGLAFCHMIREESAVPIFLLTVRPDQSDGVAGLELGADDYILRPPLLMVFRARLNAVLRRTQARATPTPAGIPRDQLRAGEILVDTASRQVFYQGKEIRLTLREFELLVYLMQHRGITLPRNLLLERVWGQKSISEARTVDVHVCSLRDKLEPDSAKPRFIQTVRGVGYRFASP